MLSLTGFVTYYFNSTTMEKSEFDRLLERYLEDKVSEAEKTRIEAWLALDKTRNDRPFAWEEEDGEILFQKITGNIDHAKRTEQFPRAESNEKKFRLGQWIRIAATILILLTASRPNWYAHNGPEMYKTIASCDLEKVILNDGTIVWLRKESKLAYFEASKGTRHAFLVGEALFEVADADRPFTIACGKITVSGLGSSFSLKNRTDSIEVRVLRGKVNLSSTKDQAGIDIAPDEELLCTANRNSAKRRHASKCRVGSHSRHDSEGSTPDIISEVRSHHQFKTHNWRRCFPKRKRA